MMTGYDEARRRTGLLNGWRAIAEYLGRNQSTTKRWETEGQLPVHRPKNSAGGKGVPVYAFTEELDAWLKGRQAELEADDGSTRDELSLADPEKPQHPQPEQGMDQIPAGSFKRRLGRRSLLVGGLAAGALLALPAGLMTLWPRGNARKVPALNDLPAEARRLYLNAYYLWQRRTQDSLHEAERLLLHVSQLAPDFGVAQADLATVYDLMVEYGVLPPAEGYSRSKSAAELAIVLDPSLASAYSVLGDIAVFWERDYELGLRHFERALALAPRDAQTRHWYASALMGLGRFEQAADEISRAREIEPLSRSIRVSEAMIRLGLKQYDDARNELLQLTANEPGYRSPYRFLSFAEFARGNYSAYLDDMATRFTLTADEAGLSIVQAAQRAFEKDGFTGMTQAMLDAIQGLPETSTIERYSLAHFSAVAGNLEMAARHLLETQTRHAFYYGIDPAFMAARHDMQFLQTVGDAGLPIIRAASL